MTEMRSPDGSLFLFTAPLYLPVSAIFPAAAPKQEVEGARMRQRIMGNAVHDNNSDNCPLSPLISPG